jgi:EVE domain
MTPQRKFWIAVAAANHVAKGRVGGFMQVNHGKQSPLKRIHAGDVIAYYSPVTEYGGKQSLKAFTGIGLIKPGEPYQGDMGGDFMPFRRDVAWYDAQPAAITPMLDTLSFTKGKTSWGYQFRFGLFDIPEVDMQLIARNMGVGDLELPANWP